MLTLCVPINASFSSILSVMSFRGGGVEGGFFGFVFDFLISTVIYKTEDSGILDECDFS